jgi:hypothetical protein
LWQKKKRLIGGKEILYIFTIKEDKRNLAKAHCFGGAKGI